MTALVAVEWRRLLARRLVRLGALISVAIILFAGVMTFLQAGRDAKNYQPRDSALLEQEIERCMREDLGPPGEIPETERRAICSDMVGFDSRFHYTETQEVLQGAGTTFILLAFLIGASFMGAEWHFGTITTTLTWEPRRLRVFAAKALVASLAGAVLYVLLEALLAAVLYPAAAVHGVTEGVDADWIASVMGDVARGAGMAAGGSAIGLSVAAIGRNTAAALGGGFLYFAVLEPILRAVRPRWVPWLVGDNAAVFITGDSSLNGRSVVEAAIVLLAYSAALVFISVAMFQRRDVTT